MSLAHPADVAGRGDLLVVNFLDGELGPDWLVVRDHFGLCLIDPVRVLEVDGARAACVLARRYPIDQDVIVGLGARIVGRNAYDGWYKRFGICPSI